MGIESASRSARPRTAVIGTGSLGKEHARIYAELAATGAIEFAGVYDLNPEAALAHAAKHNVRAFESLEAIMETADAVSVVTPTVTHFDISRRLLAARPFLSLCHDRSLLLYRYG